MRLLLVAVAVLALTAPASAQHQAFTTKLFRVSHCSAAANLSTTYVGYTPGFYPGGPYRWGDAYGYGFYQPPVTQSNPQMAVDFTNITDKVMTQVEWGLVANGRLVAEARDVGTFSPGAEIKHKYGISINVFPLQTGLPQCIALRVTFADGTHMRNPNLPAERAHMYTSPP
jgi:hypothetical protein